MNTLKVRDLCPYCRKFDCECWYTPMSEEELAADEERRARQLALAREAIGNGNGNGALRAGNTEGTEGEGEGTEVEASNVCGN